MEGNHMKIIKEKYSIKKVVVATDETIAYRKAGDGPRTFLLIHGNTSSSVWLEELMEQLAVDNTVYAIDLPGFGDSSYLHPQYSLEQISLDVMDFIMKMQLQDIYLLGWSTGGGVSMELAAKIPERIKSLILLSSIGVRGYPFYKQNIFNPFSRELIQTREEMHEYNMLVNPMLRVFDQHNRYLMQTLMERTLYNKKIPSQKLLDKYVDGALKQRNYVDILTCIANFNITNDKGFGVEGSGHADLIEAPIHIIHGDEDLVLSLDIAYDMSDYFGTQASLKIFRGCGHSILTDDLPGLTQYIRSLYL